MHCHCSDCMSFWSCHKVKYKKNELTWLKMIFWLPLEILEDMDALDEALVKAESETKLEVVGIATKAFPQVLLSPHAVLRWLEMKGRTPLIGHLPCVLQDVGPELPALYQHDSETNSYVRVAMFLGQNHYCTVLYYSVLQKGMDSCKRTYCT